MVMLFVHGLLLIGGYDLVPVGRVLVAVSFRCFGGCLGCSMW